jgi:hypothetical protein
VEFFADKIPGFDLFWNAAHTFIRVPVAALLAYEAASQLSPQLQLLAAAAGAAIAAIAHTSKTAARVLVTPSPEPISNIALSASEDVAAISLTWLATRHPYAARAQPPSRSSSFFSACAGSAPASRAASSTPRPLSYRATGQAKMPDFKPIPAPTKRKTETRLSACCTREA